MMQQLRSENLFFASRNVIRLLFNSAETLTGGRWWRTGFCRREMIISPTNSRSYSSYYRQLKKPMECVPRFCSMSVKSYPSSCSFFLLFRKKNLKALVFKFWCWISWKFIPSVLVNHFSNLQIVGEIWVQLVEFQTLVVDFGQASCPAYNLLVELFPCMLLCHLLSHFQPEHSDSPHALGRGRVTRLDSHLNPLNCISIQEFAVERPYPSLLHFQQRNTLICSRSREG